LQKSFINSIVRIAGYGRNRILCHLIIAVQDLHPAGRAAQGLKK